MAKTGGTTGTNQYKVRGQAKQRPALVVPKSPFAVVMAPRGMGPASRFGANGEQVVHFLQQLSALNDTQREQLIEGMWTIFEGIRGTQTRIAFSRAEDRLQEVCTQYEDSSRDPWLRITDKMHPTFFASRDEASDGWNALAGALVYRPQLGEADFRRIATPFVPLVTFENARIPINGHVRKVIIRNPQFPDHLRAALALSH